MYFFALFFSEVNQMKPEKSLKYQKKKLPGRYGVRCNVNHTHGGFPLHHHNYIEIEYLAKGKIQHQVNGHQSVFTPGDCWCVDNRDLHAMTVLEPVEIHNISLDFKGVPEAVGQMLSTLSFPMIGHIPQEKLPLLNELFEDLTFVTTQNTPFSKEKTVGYLLILLSLVAEYSTPLHQKPEQEGYQHIAKALAYIRENYASPLTLPQVAKTVHLSPNYFSKLFTQMNGYGFLEYLNFVRISKAKELLATTEKGVTYIAYECGFGSFSTFSRAFKNQTGYTPTEYRKRKQKQLLPVPIEQLF